MNVAWTEKANIPNLPALLERVHLHGGSIVEFQRVWSAVFYCQSGPIYRWVGPRQSRFLHGFGHAVFCFLFGWWSPAGIIWTLPGVPNNLCGGVDVTRIYTQPPPLPGEPEDPAYSRVAFARAREGLVTFVSGVSVVCFLFYLGWKHTHDKKPPVKSGQLEQR